MKAHLLILLLGLGLSGCDNTPPERKAVRDDLDALADAIGSDLSQSDFHLQVLKIETDIETLRNSAGWSGSDALRDFDLYLTDADSIWRVIGQKDCRRPDGKLEKDCLDDNPRLIDALNRYDIQNPQSLTVEEIVKPVLAKVENKIPPALAALKE